MSDEYKKLLVCNPSLSDRGAVFASDEVSADAGGANLQTQRPREVWITEVLPTVHIDVQLFDTGDVPLEHNCYLFGFCNAGAADELTITMADTQGGLFAPFQTYSGIVPLDRRRGRDWVHFLYFAGDSVSHAYPWVRFSFEINDPIIPAGYSGADFFQGGRLMIGKAFRPEHHIRYDWQITPAQQERTSVKTWAGEDVGLDRGKGRSAQFTMGWLSDAEALGEQSVESIEWIRGLSDDVLVVLDMTQPLLDKVTFVGRIEPVGSLSAGAGAKAGGYHSRSWSIVQEVAY